MVAGAAVVGLPVVAEAKDREEVLKDTYQGGRSSSWLRVLPNDKGKFSPHFQQLIEGWEKATSGHMRPVGKVTWEPLMEDGEPWLIHEAWDPPSEDNPAVMFTDAYEVFRNRRWQLIDRAVNFLRANAYWRQEYLPRAPQGLDGGGMSPATAYWRTFQRVVRKRLARVRVRFESISLTALNRHSDGEYGGLELSLLGWEDLRKAGKLTPRGYYEQRNEWLDKLRAIEAEVQG